MKVGLIYGDVEGLESGGYAGLVCRVLKLYLCLCCFVLS